ncbi:MAG TPA: autotransporter outer membrane beta-barrel domain-containing protein [Bradyrhizobium sp.]|nr:autotransporter outer membrane beta-barrel domain-containing protein [Bradyrhizobium sp.]
MLGTGVHELSRTVLTIGFSLARVPASVRIGADYRIPDALRSALWNAAQTFRSIDRRLVHQNRAPNRPASRGLRGSRFAIVLVSLILLGVSPSAKAQQCTTNPSNGGILQSGGTCVDNNPVTTGFGNAVEVSNSANVTENAAIVANGGGNGIVASTGAIDTVNANVNAANIALSAASGSTIIANNIAVGNTGGGAMAVLSNNAAVVLNNVTMSWANGFGAPLLDATNGGLIQLTNSSITVPSGSVPTVLLADGAGSRIVANDFLTLQIGTVSRSRGLGLGNGNSAIRAQNGGTIEIPDGGDVNFLTGGGNTGLLATGAGSSITTNNVNLAVGTGGSDAGALANAGGQVILNGGTVTIPGVGGGEAGLAAIGTGSAVAASDVAVNVSGAAGNAGVNAQTGGAVTMSGGSVSVVNGAGGLLQSGGTVTMTGTNVTASGAGGIGFLFNSGGSANALNYSNGTITASDASFSVQGSTANINLVNTRATVNDNVLLQTTSSGNTTFNAQASTLQGVITTDPSISTVNLTQGTVWTMTGNSNATNVTNNDSEIIYTPPTGDPTQLSSYKTLTANNYTGMGGTIALNTYLANDSAPSDRLVINGGTASGSTGLKITNSGGPGDQTVANGILVVQTLNSATTAPGAFSLLGEVRGGAYTYFLFRGGINGDAPQDWFLRSSFIVPAVPLAPLPVPPGQVPPPPPPPGQVSPPPPLVVPPPVLPADPPPAVLPPGTYPIIGPELATYGVVQPVARELGLVSLGTLNQRIGDTMTLAGAGPDASGWGRSDWGRVFGQQIEDHYQAYADPRASGWIGGFQAGVDLWRGHVLGGRDAAGVYFAYGNASVGADGLVTNPAATAYVLTHTGSLNLFAYSAGAYWTHYDPAGWYLDAVMQQTTYRGHAMTQYAQLPTNGSGLITSLESGYPIPLPLGPNFVLEPQAQIIWQQVSFDDANDGLGPIGLGTTAGPIGRLGLRGQWTIEDRRGVRWQPYVGVNYWKSWGANATTSFGINPVLLMEDLSRTEVLAGLTAKLDSGFSFYAEGSYQFIMDQPSDGIHGGVKGDAGLRYTW